MLHDLVRSDAQASFRFEYTPEQVFTVSGKKFLNFGTKLPCLFKLKFKHCGGVIKLEWKVVICHDEKTHTKAPDITRQRVVWLVHQ